MPYLVAVDVDPRKDFSVAFYTSLELDRPAAATPDCFARKHLLKIPAPGAPASCVSCHAAWHDAARRSRSRSPALKPARPPPPPLPPRAPRGCGCAARARES